MRVSLFKGGVKNTIPYVDRNVFKVLKAIKTGDYKGVIAKIRVESDKEKQNKLKIKLDYVTFSGTFKLRSDSNIIKPSGLACVDFDNVKELDSVRKLIDSDEFTFASFLSPRGNGLKVLIKIPFVDTPEDYKDYYVKIRDYYGKFSPVDTTSDLSRACFLSYDENLYLNADSEMFTSKFNRPIRDIIPVTNIPLLGDNENADRLMVWFKKHYTGVNRNNNLHALARQFNAFGVSKAVCEQYLLPYEQTGFKHKEILLLISSAYKYNKEFNSKSFEDTNKSRLVKNLVLSGQDFKMVQSKINDVPIEGLQLEFDKHKSDLKTDEFWFYNEKNNIKLATFRFLKYLENNDISKFFPSKESNSFLFIKQDNDFISEFGESRIKDFTLSDLRGRGLIDAFELCADRMVTFTQSYLSMIKTSEVEIQRDTKDTCYVYYTNKAVKITRNKFELIDYKDLAGKVWRDQVIDRDIVLKPESEGEFGQFINLISNKEEERYFSMKSVIGYLLHSYQNEGKPKVIVFNDELISDVANGGSGKSLIHKAIGYIKKLSSIDGKTFDPMSQFAYQTVDTDTQVLLIDDIDINFKFENLYSLVTEGITIEKKGKDAIKLPFSDSPKMSITTNYVLQGKGSSFTRRIYEIELSSHFNDRHTPEDEFKHLLFSAWDKVEWEKFDNYMLRCIQYYLKNGLKEMDSINIELKRLKRATNLDFLDFMESQTFTGQRYYGTELKDLFLIDYPEYSKQGWFGSRLFNKWVALFCSFSKFKKDSGKTNGKRWASMIDPEAKTDNVSMKDAVLNDGDGLPY